MGRKNAWSDFLILGLILVTACASPKSPIITDTQCSPPCWHNITPGQTTDEELRNILLHLSMISAGNIVHHSWYDGYKHYYFGELNTQEEILIASLDDNVSLIDFSGVKVKQGLGISFGEAINIFGEPKFIISSKGAGFGRFLGNITGPVTFLYVSALYPETGIWFTTGFALGSYNNDSNLNISIEPKIELTEIKFFDINQYKNLADKGEFSFQNYRLGEMVERMHPWTGYGDLDTKYPYIP